MTKEHLSSSTKIVAPEGDIVIRTYRYGFSDKNSYLLEVVSLHQSDYEHLFMADFDKDDVGDYAMLYVVSALRNEHDNIQEYGPFPPSDQPLERYTPPGYSELSAFWHPSGFGIAVENFSVWMRFFQDRAEFDSHIRDIESVPAEL